MAVEGIRRLFSGKLSNVVRVLAFAGSQKGTLVKHIPHKKNSNPVQGVRNRYVWSLRDRNSFSANSSLAGPIISTTCQTQDHAQPHSYRFSYQPHDNDSRSTSGRSIIFFNKSNTSCNDGSDNERSSGGSSNQRPMKLMDFPEIIWPHPFKSIRNKFLNLLIRGYFDNKYGADSFLQGAEQAMTCVSSLLSEGKFEEMEGLVSRDAIRELKRNYNLLSAEQKRQIAVKPADLFFRFIYEVGMIFDDATDQRFVEITAVFQGFHGLEAVKDGPPESFNEFITNHKDKLYICNYRFIREFTNGVEDQWTINILNHFNPQDVVDKTDLFRR